MKSLDIDLVTETYPPEHGGAPRALHRFVELLRGREHQVTVVRPRQRHEAVASARATDFLVRSVAFPFDRTLRMGLPEVLRLTTRWQKKRPDLVHVATQGPLGAAAMFVARRLQLPISTSFHTNFHQFAAHYGVTVLVPAIVAYLRGFHNRAAVTLVPSERARKKLSELGFERLRVVGRGVDRGRFHPRRRSAGLRRSLGVGDDDLLLLCVGRLAPEKNIELAIESARAVNRVTSARLVFVGDGPLRAGLERAHAGVRFVGHKDGDDLARHYASADMFVFPSRTETFGNVVLEAMASGLPVVAFDDAAAAECIRSGFDGMTAPLDAPERFVEAAARVAADVCLRSALGSRARATSGAFTWDVVGDALARELGNALHTWETA